MRHFEIINWAVIISSVIAVLFSPKAEAASVDYMPYCTPANPVAPYNRVCTGYGTSCDLRLTYSCNANSGVPGTWGPGGYTPR